MSLAELGARSRAGEISVGVVETSPLTADVLVAALRAAGITAGPLSADSDLDGVDVVLADSLLSPDRLEGLAGRVARRPGCRLVLVSRQDTRAVRQTTRCVEGVTTFERSRSIDDLVTTVREVARGTIQARETADHGGVGPSSLTARELQILDIIAGGATNEGVAEALGISPHTVRSHLCNILGKLGVTGRLGAVTVVRQAGLLPRPRSATR